MATKPAAYSRLPSANSFHTITMAMQRAKPIRINPIIYSGWSRKKIMANANIKIGPTTQFKTKERVRTLVSLKTVGKVL